jgi:hypothetical protein
MKRISLLLSLTAVFLLSSCLKDLDREPFYEQTSLVIYKDPKNYIHVLAKLYAGLSVTGQAGPAGNADISTSIVDEGFSQYLRMFWNLQELPTDEAKCRWNDTGIPDLGKWTWSDGNQWVRGGYLRFLYQITSCNEFIKQTTDELLDERGFSEADKASIRIYRAEARFLRALSVFHALDIFGDIPDITDENRFPGTEFPSQSGKETLFNFVESELLAVEPLLPVKSATEYGRANKSGAHVLLAKLYLNAQAMIGNDRYAEVIPWCEKVINDGGYALESKYTNLFRADNQNSSEIIFPVTCDGNRTLSYGATTYLINAAGFPTTRTAKNLFTENFGQVTNGPIAIGAHTFNNDTLSITSGAAEQEAVINDVDPSAGYGGASSQANVYFASAGAGFAIGNIVTTNRAGLQVQFGWWKSSAFELPQINIEYSTNNGSSWAPITFIPTQTSTSAAGWYLSPLVNLPIAAENQPSIWIRWVNGGGTPFSIDDITFKYLNYSAIGSSYPGLSLIDSTGSSQGWQGLLACKELVNFFTDGAQDSRFQFVTGTRVPDISVLPNTPLNEGYIVKKFRNLRSDNVAGANNSFADTDWPLFRLADVYLMYVEAHIRSGAGSAGNALTYLNDLRQRAYGNANYNFSALPDLDGVLTERARELYWEGYRRTDLIRFGKFAGSNYLWTWKGNLQGGSSGSSHQNLYPLPATELNANPNLKQNPGY